LAHKTFSFQATSVPEKRMLPHLTLFLILLDPDPAIFHAILTLRDPDPATFYGILTLLDPDQGV
jgi:hypothetical protein